MTDSSQAILYDLNDLGVATISGTDARQFLQGQLSNDIDILSAEQPHQLSAYCNPKGRMLALFHVLHHAEQYCLIAPNAILDKVLPRLKMFVMRSKVDVERRADLHVLGLQTRVNDNEAFRLKLEQSNAITAQHYNDPGRSFVLLASEARGDFDVTNNNNDWNVEDIKQQLPQLYIETYEALIPQSTNLDIVEGVNFKKGCFPGQEIIARVKYRGKPKTRMIGVSIRTDKAIELGLPVFIEGRNSAAGMVLNLATQSGETLMSISLPVTHLNEGEIYLDEAKTISVTRLDQAYPVTI